MMMIVTNPCKNPCKDCKGRKVGCHSDCAKYADFRKAVDEFNAKRRAASSSFVEDYDRGRRWR